MGGGGTLTLTTIDNEPRVLDTALAEQLVMARPRDIRANLIEPNREELEAYGPLCEERTQTGGRPSNEFHLNRQQALLVCILSHTERAEVVRRLTAWQHSLHAPRLGVGEAMPIVFLIISLVLTVAQVIGYKAGMEAWFHVGPWVIWPVFVVCLFFRGLGILFISVVAFYGFTKGMGWEWWKALLVVVPGPMFVAATIVLTGASSFVGSFFRS